MNTMTHNKYISGNENDQQIFIKDAKFGQFFFFGTQQSNPPVVYLNMSTPDVCSTTS